MSFVVDTVHLLDPRHNPPGLPNLYKALICLTALCLLTVTYVQLRAPKPTPITFLQSGEPAEYVRRNNDIYSYGQTSGEANAESTLLPPKYKSKTLADNSTAAATAAVNSETTPIVVLSTELTATTGTKMETNTLNTAFMNTAHTDKAFKDKHYTDAVTLESSQVAGRECYEHKNTTNFDPKLVELLTDVLASEKQPLNDIFFHETSCLSGVAQLNARQACAIESTALANPDRRVFVLFASPVGFARDQDQPKLFQALNNYTNINLRNVDLATYATRTPAEEFLAQPALFASDHVQQDLSEILRLVTLYKFGGTHVGWDYIFQQPIQTQGSNFAGLLAMHDGEPLQLSDGLMNFEADGVGHVLAERVIRLFVEKYNATVWPELGQKLLTQSIVQSCRSTDVTLCTIFTALPPTHFNPVAESEWVTLFEEHTEAKLPHAVADAIAVRFWNGMSAKTPVQVGGHSVYDVLAQKRCPHVYETLKGNEIF